MFAEPEDLEEMTPGEDFKNLLGKIAKAVSTLITHVSAKATTSIHGHVKLTDSVSSTSTTTAAVPANVKAAYDKAEAALPKANISQSSAISVTGAYALDATEKNASIEGTLANQIAAVNSGLNEKVNVSDIVNNLTSTATNKPLSAAQGRTLKSYIDNLAGGSGNTGLTGEALRLLGASNENCVYGNYNFGIFFVKGSEDGLPLTGYAGFIITLRWTTSRIVKVLILVNGYTYIMSQENDGTVVSPWTRLQNV